MLFVLHTYVESKFRTSRIQPTPEASYLPTQWILDKVQSGVPIQFKAVTLLRIGGIGQDLPRWCGRILLLLRGNSGTELKQ